MLTDERRRRLVFVICALSVVACDRPEPLTAAKAEEIIRRVAFRREIIYAEVPQRVSFGPRSPKDDYDGKAVATLHKLRDAGLVTVTESREPDGTETYVAKVTAKGFPILGTAPSVRGPVYRGHICDKVYDGLRNFQRHPNEPTTGHAELAWHYENPTPLYPLFDTKINKPLKKTFASHVSFHYRDGEWRFHVNVKKVEAE